VRLLSGENHRERVLTVEEEGKYLDAATAIVRPGIRRQQFARF